MATRRVRKFCFRSRVHCNSQEINPLSIWLSSTHADHFYVFWMQVQCCANCKGKRGVKGWLQISNACLSSSNRQLHSWWTLKTHIGYVGYKFVRYLASLHFLGKQHVASHLFPFPHGQSPLLWKMYRTINVSFTVFHPLYNILFQKRSIKILLQLNW